MKMNKWHAHVVDMAKHMNMVGGPVWWGARAPCPPKFGAGCRRECKRSKCQLDMGQL